MMGNSLSRLSRRVSSGTSLASLVYKTKKYWPCEKTHSCEEDAIWGFSCGPRDDMGDWWVCQTHRDIWFAEHYENPCRCGYTASKHFQKLTVSEL